MEYIIFIKGKSNIFKNIFQHSFQQFVKFKVQI